ncbi:hypothetical protein [Immundisolibacter sp.]
MGYNGDEGEEKENHKAAKVKPGLKEDLYWGISGIQDKRKREIPRWQAPCFYKIFDPDSRQFGPSWR